MSNEVVKAEVVPSLVNMSIDIDKADVGAILLARAEKQLKTNINACAAKEKKLQAEHREINVELQKQLRDAATASSKKTLDLLTEAAEALGCKHVNNAVGVTGTDPSKGMLTYNLIVRGEKPHINWSVAADAKVTAEIKANWKASEAKQKEIGENSQDWLEQRRKLQDLPSMERIARGAIAEARLNKSAEGKEILALLESEGDAGIKLLGIS